jgi:NAD+ diphosphatase
MLQDIAPHVYRNEMSFRAPGPDDYVLAFSGKDTIYGMKTDGGFRLPRLRELKKRPQSLQYLFSVDEEAYDLWEDEAIPEADGFAFVKTGDLRTLPPAETRFACAVSESLRRWYGGTRFCGRCGAKMEKSKIERAMVCPVCGNTVYPKICPGVIAAVCDGERIVLTRYKNRPFKKYALVAGFTEIGESSEDTVRREVLEETGLHVKNLRFYKSQPWVYTDTLLTGFFADLDGSDQITVQEDELAEARWFRRDEIPDDFSGVSLTGEMISLFRAGGI